MAEYHKYIKYVSCVKFADMTVKRRYRKGYYYVKKYYIHVSCFTLQIVRQNITLIVL